MNRTHLGLFVSAICVGIFLSTSTPTARADALDNWTTNQVSTNSFQLNRVVYGGGRYVAAGGLGDGGVLMSSEDGVNWTLRAYDGSSGPPSLVWGLTYGGGRFVAVGHFGGTASSTNGIDWTINYGGDGWPDSLGLSGVAYGNGVYVAVGNNSGSVSSIFTSTNGIHWTAPPKHPSEVRDVYDVAFGTRFGTGFFVAVAEGGYIYRQTGDSFWLRSGSPMGVGSRISYCRDLLITPVSAGVNLLSLDGISWAAVNTGVAKLLGKPIYAAGMFFARAGNSLTSRDSFATSTDGTNWVLRTQQFPTWSSDIASDGSRLVIVGATSPGWNAFTFTSDSLLEIGIEDASPHRIKLTGVVNRPYRVEFLPSLPSSATNPWQTLTNLILPSSPYFIADHESPSAAQRYYRAVLLP
ncbi:MAG: hypothetical protein IH623_19150 [Verrucomicrobia bacterium]|nr:hypothetical protein [Verrucomicrobiota bacterium]